MCNRLITTMPLPLLPLPLLLAVLLQGPGAVEAVSYIDYTPGNCNIILAAPHGGYVNPTEIPLLRDAGCRIDGACVWTHTCTDKDFSLCKAKNIRDAYTKEITLGVAAALLQNHGCQPYVVINLLHRGRLDANREKPEATFGVAAAEEAWEEFHAKIEEAKAAIGGRGFLVDVHGVGVKTHPRQWVEIGYTISKSKLESGSFTEMDSSLRHLSEVFTSIPVESTVRGGDSMGKMFDDLGYDVVPSPINPSPGADGYFIGGYDLREHGSKYGGEFDAIQIELPRHLRDDHANFSPILADIIHQYWQKYYQ